MDFAMTCSTVTGFYWPMPVFRISDLVTKIEMTLEAKFLHGVSQQRLVIRRMGTVTVRTASVINRLMFELGSGYFLKQLGTCLQVAILA